MRKKKYKKLAKNTVIFAVGSFGTRFLNFFLMPLYTSCLTTSDYGTADIITTTYTLLIFVFTLNISDAVLRFVLDDIRQRRDILKYGVKIIMTGTGLLLPFVILSSVLNIFNIALYCYIFLYLGFVFNAYYKLFLNYLQAIDNVKSVAVANILQSFITVMLNIWLLVYWDMHLFAYLVSITASTGIACFYLLLIIYKQDVKSIEIKLIDKSIKKSMLLYSIPLIFNNICWWINASLDKYFISGICGIDQNGIYSVASKIPTIMTAFLTVFLQAWSLSAVQEFDDQDQDGFFSQTYAIFNICIIVLCSILIMMNKTLARILYANEFYIAWSYSSTLLFSAVFSALSSFLGAIFSAVKDSKLFAKSTIYAALVNSMLNIVLIPIWGVHGAAVATVISFIVIWLIRLIATKKYINLKLQLTKNILCYLILFFQIFLEHISNMFVFQVIVVFTLLWINKEELIFYFKKTLKRIVK